MIDLHMHTTASDGERTPAEILQKCEALGLELISISDHYTMDGYDQLKDPAVRSLFSGEILPACEFSAHFNGISIEVLGYGIDPEDARDYLKKTYPPLKEKQRREMEQLILQYRERGFQFDEAAVRSNFNAHGGRTAMQIELRRYPENVARFFDPASETSEKSFLRREVSNPESPYFMNTEGLYPSAKEVCETIRSLGGKAVIAHPGCYNQRVYENLETLIQTARPDGLEAWYSTHTPEQRQHLLSLCEKYDLIYSGGSDYHNDAREKVGNVLGMAELADIFPVKEIRQWADKLKKI
ncbi:MAG: PHP domain-containing protein [Clostridia bacterium]|nr:PHP domain-containing protein [Clostridia bacterium]